MPTRLLPNLLLHLNPAALAPPRAGVMRRNGFAHIIGKGFPEIMDKPLPTTHDASSAPEIAFREWLAHVEAGRIS